MLKRSSPILALALLVCSCSSKPILLQAWQEESVERNATVSVALSSDDAEEIKSREFYFSMVIIECDGNGEGYPMEPFVQGMRATDFDYPIVADRVVFSGEIPTRLFRGYRRPCLFLRGGNYLRTRIHSTAIAIPSA